MHVGDLLLFKGNGFFSNLITALPGSDYSHVGAFVVFNGTPCVFESTSLGTLPDVITDELIDGVQLTRFEDRVKSYDGEVFHREIIGRRTEEQLTALHDFILEHHGKPYEQSNWELANAELDLFPWNVNKPDDSSMFCSETTAMMLRAMQVLRATEKPANEFTPSDFAGTLDFLEDYRAGPIRQVQE